MPEREYTDYDEWLQSGGDPTYGQGASQTQYPVPTEQPPYPGWPHEPPPGWPETVPTAPPTTPTTGGRRPRDEVEREGRDRDAREGRVGGYYDETSGTWISGERPSGGNPPPPGGYGGPGGFGGGGDFGGFAAGRWPTYTPGNFDAGPAFTFREFVGPTSESMMKDPGFQFRIDQGRKALESSAAGKGVLRSGGTLKDILGYGQNFASQEYGNVYNRALQEYDTNRNNAADIWGKQYGQRKDQYTFGEDANRFGFNQKQRQAELDAKELFDRWQTEGGWLRDLSVAGMD